MGKFLTFLVLISTVYCMPAWAQANTDQANNYTNQIKYVSADVVNVRTEPTTDSEIITQLSLNDSVVSISEENDWTLVYSEALPDDEYAYIKSDYLSEVPVLYSEEELNIMAHVLAGECQSYPDQEQLYVGSVVLNRVEHDEFPDSIKEVVFQRGQYACTRDGNYYREPTERNWANAKWLLENGSILPEKVVYQSGGRQGAVYLKTKYHYYCY